jgi:hypothetical protein
VRVTGRLKEAHNIEKTGGKGHSMKIADQQFDMILQTRVSHTLARCSGLFRRDRNRGDSYALDVSGNINAWTAYAATGV